MLLPAVVGLAITVGVVLASPCHAQTPYPAPPPYRAWYDHMLACSGIVHPKVAFDALQFVAVADSGFAADGRWGFIAYTYPADKTIVVIQDSVWSEQVVSHEMLHAILGGKGHGPMFQLCGIFLGDPLRQKDWPRDAVEDSP